MSWFAEHTIESAPPGSRRFMAATQQQLGYLPAATAQWAASPQDTWIRSLDFTAATTLFDDNAEQSKKLLNQSIDGFTASMLAMPDPNLVRENTLGRAFCERELGKFDHAEYDHAIADFKKIMDDGTSTQQYAAARQGLSTTYAKMGKADEAAKLITPGEGGGKGLSDCNDA